MIVIGAGGFAKEIVDILLDTKKYNKNNLFFFDDVNLKNNNLYGYKVIHTLEEIKRVFEKGQNNFCLGIGSPIARYNLYKKFKSLGGKVNSIVSSNSFIGKQDVQIGEGACVLCTSTISNGVEIGRGALINADVLVGHDVRIGDFADISPGVKLTGHSIIGNYVTIGAAAVVLPRVKIGDNSYIAAGSVVANDVPENSMVVGIVPSRVVSTLPKFEE